MQSLEATLSADEFKELIQKLKSANTKCTDINEKTFLNINKKEIIFLLTAMISATPKEALEEVFKS